MTCFSTIAIGIAITSAAANPVATARTPCVEITAIKDQALKLTGAVTRPIAGRLRGFAGVSYRAGFTQTIIAPRGPVADGSKLAQIVSRSVRHGRDVATLIGLAYEQPIGKGWEIGIRAQYEREAAIGAGFAFRF